MVTTEADGAVVDRGDLKVPASGDCRLQGFVGQTIGSRRHPATVDRPAEKSLWQRAAAIANVSVPAIGDTPRGLYVTRDLG